MRAPARIRCGGPVIDGLPRPLFHDEAELDFGPAGLAPTPAAPLAGDANRMGHPKPAGYAKAIPLDARQSDTPDSSRRGRRAVPAGGCRADDRGCRFPDRFGRIRRGGPRSLRGQRRHRNTVHRHRSHGGDERSGPRNRGKPQMASYRDHRRLGLHGYRHVAIATRRDVLSQAVLNRPDRKIPEKLCRHGAALTRSQEIRIMPCRLRTDRPEFTLDPKPTTSKPGYMDRK